ncbi:MAG: hypothetical protein AAFX55_09465 [Bacteroidota bacterium]
MKTGIIIALIIIAVLILISSIRKSNSTNTEIKSNLDNEKNEVPNSIFFHEDAYKQVELIPEENFDELIKQARNVQDFVKQHFDQGGYTDIMIRKENGFKLIQRRIKLEELDSILSDLPIKKYTEVSTGIKPEEMKSPNTFGYGENYNGIFFDFESDFVKGIWIAGTPEVHNEKLVQALNTIGTKWNLLLMDWNSLELIDLKNKEQIEKYLD